MSDNEKDPAGCDEKGVLQANEILDGMDPEWSPACLCMGDDTPSQPGVEGDHVLDGLANMESL